MIIKYKLLCDRNVCDYMMLRLGVRKVCWYDFVLLKIFVFFKFLRKNLNNIFCGL